MKERKRLKIEAIGYEDQLAVLAHFLRNIQYLGSLGATRTLKLWVDGDGAARLRFVFPELEQELLPRPFDDEEKKGDNAWKFYIE